MGYDVAILHNGPDGGCFLPIDDNISTLYGIFLESISRKSYYGEGVSHIVLNWPVPKLRRKYIQELSTSPTFFAIGVIGIMIRKNPSQAIFEVVRTRPRVTRRGQNSRSRIEDNGFSFRILDGSRGDECHAQGPQRLLLGQISENTCRRRRSQVDNCTRLLRRKYSSQSRVETKECRQRSEIVSTVSAPCPGTPSH